MAAADSEVSVASLWESVDEERVLAPWEGRRVSQPGVPSLQDICCGVLARHLYALESLDYLPDHLSCKVRSAIQNDRRLISDDGLAVWLDAALASGNARRINLRWASSLTDAGLSVLAGNGAWSSSLVALDLGFCECVTDAGVQVLAPTLHALEALVLTGCRRCGDGACVALGRHAACIERIELELLHRVSDAGVQALVRGCPRLADLRLGGCKSVTGVSTSLIADHCAGRMHRLGLGGLVSLTDVDLEDVGRMSNLTRLELCACVKLSDTGVKQIGLLASRQAKAADRWEAGGRLGACPPLLAHLDLGGLCRMSDEALHKLATRARGVVAIDLRGCTRLSEDGLARVLAGVTAGGVQTGPIGSLAMPLLRSVTLTACGGATDNVVRRTEEARPGVQIVR